MADLLSICVAVATAAKILYQSSVSLYSFIEGSIHIDQSIQDLLKEFNSLKNVAFAIGKIVSNPSFRDKAWLDESAQELFPLLEGSLKGCIDVLQQFETAVFEVQSSPFKAKVLRQPMARMKLDMKSTYMVLLRGQISSHFNAMQLGLQTINLSASLRGPELVINVLSSKINNGMIGLDARIEDKLDGFDTKLYEITHSLEKLIAESSQRQTEQIFTATFDTPPAQITDGEKHMKEAAERVVSSAKSVISSRSTAAGGSVYNYGPNERLPFRNTSIYGSEMGDEKRQIIAQWTSGLDPLAEGSVTSVGLESSTWTATTADSDSEDEMADDTFDALTDKGEQLYKEGKIAESEAIIRKAVQLADSTNLRSRSAQKHNNAILRLASIQSEQSKFAEAKGALEQLLSMPKVDLSPEEAQQMIQGSHILAETYLELNELFEAERACKEAMRARRRISGKDSPDYQESMKLLLVIHETQGQAESVVSPSVESGSDKGKNGSSTYGRSESLHSPMIQVSEKMHTPNRVDSLPLPTPQKAGPNTKTVVKPTRSSIDEFFGVPVLPKKPINERVPVTTVATPYLSEDIKIKQAFDYLETKAGYGFWSADFDPQAALLTAVKNMHLMVAWLLLNRPVEISQRYIKKTQHRSTTGERRLSRSFLAKPDANFTNSQGPLLFQVFWPSVNSSESLLVSDQCGMADILLKAGSNANAKWSGVTPLIKASSRGQWDFLSVLVQAGANVNSKDENNHTPLYFAIEKSDSGAEDAVCKLLEYGADTDIKFDNGSISALVKVAFRGWDRAAGAILKNGAAIERRSGTQVESPLGAAAFKGFLSVARVLLKGGASIEGKSYSSETYATPLYIAARHGHCDMVELLLDHGADIEADDTVGNDTPLSVAAWKNRKDVVKILLKRNANTEARDGSLSTPLLLASANGLTEIVRMLLEYGADVNAERNDNSTPLYKAVQNGHEETVQLLLEHKADTDVMVSSSVSALSLAARAGNEKIMVALLEHGADFDAEDNLSRTALHLAAKYGHTGIVRELLAHNADIEAKSNDGSRPLHLAARLGHVSTVELLLRKGCKNKANDFGFTALTLAVKAKQSEVVKVLKKYEEEAPMKDELFAPWQKRVGKGLAGAYKVWKEVKAEVE